MRVTSRTYRARDLAEGTCPFATVAVAVVVAVAAVAAILMGSFAFRLDR